MAFYGRTGGPRRRKDEAVARMLEEAVSGFAAGREKKRERQAAAEQTAYERAEAQRKADLEERRVKALEEGVAFKGEAKKGNETERIIKRTGDLTSKFLAKQPKPISDLDRRLKEAQIKATEALANKRNQPTASETAAASRNDLDVLRTIMQEVQDELRVPKSVKVPGPLPFMSRIESQADTTSQVTAADLGKIREKMTEYWGKTIKPERMSELLRTIRENWAQLGGSGPPPQIDETAGLSTENPEDVNGDEFEATLRRELGL